MDWHSGICLGMVRSRTHCLGDFKLRSRGNTCYLALSQIDQKATNLALGFVQWWTGMSLSSVKFGVAVTAGAVSPRSPWPHADFSVVSPHTSHQAWTLHQLPPVYRFIPHCGSYSYCGFHSVGISESMVAFWLQKGSLLTEAQILYTVHSHHKDVTHHPHSHTHSTPHQYTGFKQPSSSQDGRPSPQD